MRSTLLLSALLMLAACGKNDQANSVQNAGDGLTAQDIVSNDVTAIDAVTGDAANMAADVDVNYGGVEDNALETTSGEPTAKSARPMRPATRPSTSVDSNAATNSTANSTSNAE
jgi:hypothetical protein